MITPRISRRHVRDDVAGIVSRSPGVPMLEVSDLVKRYGNVLALDGCSLQVPAGHQPHSSRSGTHWRAAVSRSSSCAGALPGAAGGQAGDRQRAGQSVVAVFYTRLGTLPVRVSTNRIAL
jgi:hypothetical protein